MPMKKEKWGVTERGTQTAHRHTCMHTGTHARTQAHVGETETVRETQRERHTHTGKRGCAGAGVKAAASLQLLCGTRIQAIRSPSRDLSLLSLLSCLATGSLSDSFRLPVSRRDQSRPDSLFQIIKNYWVAYKGKTRPQRDIQGFSSSAPSNLGVWALYPQKYRGMGKR